jgi:hypothetical protein
MQIYSNCLISLPIEIQIYVTVIMKAAYFITIGYKVIETHLRGQRRGDTGRKPTYLIQVHCNHSGFNCRINAVPLHAMETLGRRGCIALTHS